MSTELPAHERAASVTPVRLRWGNAYILSDGQSAALIDSGLPQDRITLLGGLRALGLSEKDVTHLYLTHAHCDHAGSAAHFLRAGAEVALSEAESIHLRAPRRGYGGSGLRSIARPVAALAFAAGEILYPVEPCGEVTGLRDGETVEAPGGPLRVISCPGHTSGHVAFYREGDGTLFSGDAILTIVPIKRIPGLSLPMGLFTEDMAVAARSARELAQLKPRALMPGHGEPWNENVAPRLTRWAESLAPGLYRSCPD